MNPEPKKQVFELIDKLEVSPAAKTMAKSIVMLGGNPVQLLVAALFNEQTAAAELKHPKLPMPKDYTEVERVIHEMMVENTGVHVLDSGDIYGRHWEENRRIRDFRKTPKVFVSEYDISLNVFHYLRHFLERDDVARMLEGMLYEYAEQWENRDKSWLSIMYGFVEILERSGWEAEPGFNSYNWENYLSQVIQGIVIHGEPGDYVILQLHNGCDVRGGYTKPRVFKLVEDAPGDFYFMMDEIIACCKCGSSVLESGYNPGCDDDGDVVWNKERGAFYCKRCRSKVRFYPAYDEY
jgi:hypothetical protein